MKITIEERINKAGDKKSIRLVYWNGSYTDKDGKYIVSKALHPSV